jgi:hypothetical protein
LIRSIANALSPEGIYLILARPLTFYYFAFFPGCDAGARALRNNQAAAKFHFGAGSEFKAQEPTIIIRRFTTTDLYDGIARPRA